MICPNCKRPMRRTFFDNEQRRQRDEALTIDVVWTCDPCPKIGGGIVLVRETAK